MTCVRARTSVGVADKETISDAHQQPFSGYGNA